MSENGFEVSELTRADGSKAMLIIIDDMRIVTDQAFLHAAARDHHYDSKGKYRSFDEAIVDCAKRMKGK